MSEDQKLKLRSNVEVVVLDLPPLTDEHVEQPGVYVGVVATDPAEDFSTAAVVVSADDGVSYEPIEALKGEVVAAHVVGTCGGGVTGRFWDTVTVLRIELMRGAHEDAMANAPDEDVWAGRKNILAVGDEIIGFAEATATGDPRVWDLTRLARGRRGTEQWIDLHAENEKVVLLTSPSSLEFVPLSLNHVSPQQGAPNNLRFRAVASGLPATDATHEQIIPFQARTLQAFSPTVLPAVRDSSGNILISWVPRSARPFRLLGYVLDMRLWCCGCDEYLVEILAADRSEVLRRFVILNRTSFIYTAAYQVIDFGSTQSTVQINIYKNGQMIGRGFTDGGEI